MAAGGRTVLITGSTDGVGRRVAGRLARVGTTILVHGRDQDRAEGVLATIRRDLAAAIKRDHHRLDVLVNNAGIGVGRDGCQVSQDGHELRFAVNYLSGFLLTRLLLPLLKARPGSKIVNASSVAQQKIDFADVMLTRGDDGRRAYCQSKLAQIMFTFDLAQELKSSGVTTDCPHPAIYMDTTMVRFDGISPMNSVDDGANAILQLTHSPELNGETGRYFGGMRPSRANGQAYDTAARADTRDVLKRRSSLQP